ncbi:hypothetical protein QFZ99_004751 [Paraburkholderia atlantica]|uniref:hypothetical protein n=1 Tax=Paraburkholderia atlantica TaxID=2654982 RepID=UPI003D215390
MSLNALLAARAHTEGRAQPTALFRHRAITETPIGIVAWQLGAEPYSVGAIAIGQSSSGFRAFVPGYPLDRDLLFAALLDFAHEFCTRFESYTAGPVTVRKHFGAGVVVPVLLPQIVVPNRETIALLGRLGRRLAYLPTAPVGDRKPADPLLPRLGRHLMWIAEYAQLPGQQLALPIAELLATHYATAMSAFEVQSLPAMNAWIDPPAGIHGFVAAQQAERLSIGPIPDPKDGQDIFAMMQLFNLQRKRSTDPKLIAKLIPSLRERYVSMIEATWDLMWAIINREKTKPEAASVIRRAQADCLAYAEHMQWMNGPAEGRRKTRMTARNAAMRLNEYEQTQARLEAEEAIDDPLRMAPHLLAGKAFAGTVIASDSGRTEIVNARNCLRPSVTVRTDVPCLMQPGTDLWWTCGASGREWKISHITPNGTGSTVTLILQTNRLSDSPVPTIGQRTCFSLFNLKEGYELFLPVQAPWTHRLPVPAIDSDLEHTDDGGLAA